MYLALYRKWRPKSFDDVISQPHIVSTLKNEIQTGRIAHAYLFTGSRGTGKTTCAKLLAKAVNCLRPKDGDPCQTCEICKGLEDGTILDVNEMDAASNNSVDDIRALREEAAYTPVSCKYRVYIIDEAHMLTSSAFNAFLKIMEEPPEHVIFILATTEVHKIPPTIVSRCQRFDFRRIKVKDIVKRLLEIAEQEEFRLDPDAAALIAKTADGAMRDALSLLDLCAAVSNEITLQSVVDVAGIAGQAHLFAIHQAIVEQNPSHALAILDTLYQGSKDLGLLCREMISFYRDVLLLQTAQSEEGLLSCAPEDTQQLHQVAEGSTPTQSISVLNLLQQTLDRMGKTGSKRLELEICMIRLCTPSLQLDLDGMARRLELLENAGSVPAVPSFDEDAVSVEGTKEAAKPEKLFGEQDSQDTIHLEKLYGAQKRQEMGKPEKPFDTQDVEERTKPERPSSAQNRQEAVKPERSFGVQDSQKAMQPEQGSDMPAEQLPSPMAFEQQLEPSSVDETKRTANSSLEASVPDMAAKQPETQQQTILETVSTPQRPLGQEPTVLKEAPREDQLESSKDGEPKPPKEESIVPSENELPTPSNNELPTPSENELPTPSNNEDSIAPRDETVSQITPLQCWKAILESLQQEPNCGMISGFLAGSQAWQKGDKLLIQSAVPVVAERVLAKKDVLDRIILQHTGKQYRLFFKQQKEETQRESSQLETLLQKAQSAGIAIENDE